MNLNNISSNPNLYPKPNLSPDEEIDLQNHSGEIWNCIGKHKSPHGGYIYQFIPKEEYDNFSPNQELITHIANVKKKSLEIFPASEPSPRDTWRMCEDRRAIDVVAEDEFLEEIWDEKKQLTPEVRKKYFEENVNDKIELSTRWEAFQLRREFLKEVGYQVLIDENNRLQLELPDLEALHNGWKHLQALRPELQLPDLDVAASEGIADDLSYAEAYRHHDALLSTGKEFVHDHTVHVMTRIYRMLNGKEAYQAEREKILSLISNVQATIQEAKKREEPNGIIHREKENLDFIVGILTDGLFAFGEDLEIQAYANPEMVEKLISNPELVGNRLNNYLEKRFGRGTNYDSISNLWKEVRRLVPLEKS